MPDGAIIVMGASAGAVEALQRVIAHLDPDIPAAIFVVLHVPAHGTSVLRHGGIAVVQDPDEALHHGMPSMRNCTHSDRLHASDR